MPACLSLSLSLPLLGLPVGLAASAAINPITVDHNLNPSVTEFVLFFVSKFYFFQTVGCCAPIRVRTGPFRGSRGAPTSADVEQSTAYRFRTVARRRVATRQFHDPRAILHRPLPLSPRQHFRIPGKFIILLNNNKQL